MDFIARLTVKKIAAIILAVVCAIMLWTSLYRVDATEVVVFQAPFTGRLSVEAQPGTYVRFGSSVQDYRKQDNYSFEYSGKENDRSILVQFNDGGKAQIGGNVQMGDADRPRACPGLARAIWQPDRRRPSADAERHQSGDDIYGPADERHGIICRASG